MNLAYRMSSHALGLSVLALLMQFGAFLPAAHAETPAEVHVISFYEGPPAGPGATVVIKKKDAPLILVLASYESTVWDVEVEDGVKLERVVVDSYEDASARVSSAGPDHEFIDFPIEYFIDEKVCYPGETRPADSPTSFGSNPTNSNPRARQKFLEALTAATGIDASNAKVRARYTGKFRYVIK